MVLICNNNVLTIEQWHKNRCEEKREIKNIIIDRKYNKNKIIETPEKPTKINTTYSKSIELNSMDSINSLHSIQISSNKKR
jgi:hypothetical protein